MKKKASNFTSSLQEKELSYESDDGRFMAQFEQIDKNLVRFTFKGYANLLNAIQTMLILDKILDNAQQSGHPGRFYLIANLIDFSGTQPQARHHFVKGFTEYFHAGIICAIALVSPNWIIQTLAVLGAKIYNNVKFSYHTSEQAAYNKVTALMAQSRETAPQDLFDMSNGVETKKIILNEHTFRVKPLPSCQVTTQSYTIGAVILNDEIIVSKYKGVVSVPGLRKYTEIMKYAIGQCDKQRLFHIVDFNEVTRISYAAKRILKDVEVDFKPHFLRSYFILSGVGKLFYNMYKILFPSRMKNRILVNSYHTAINKIAQDLKTNKDLGKKTDKPFPISKRTLYTATKKELLNIIEIQNEAMETLWKNQQDHIDELFEIMSRITWDESFSPRKLDVDSEDPFYNLYGAASMLQQDVYEMIRELKQLNRSLEEKIAERTKKLKQQNNDLQKVNEEMDRFFYIIAHDLRAPLASLLGLTRLCRIELGKKEDAVIESYHEKMERSILKMDNFITDITKYYKNKRLELKPERIKIKQLILDSLEDLNILNNKNIKVNLNIKQKGQFYSDKLRMQIIMNNLISNAVRYSREPGDNPYITVDALVNESMAEIKVEDNGQGIAEKHLVKIFDMFYRASTEKSGSGLGLYIVKEIVEKLKGTIDVKSRVKEGTTFIIKIPTFKK